MATYCQYVLENSEDEYNKRYHDTQYGFPLDDDNQLLLFFGDPDGRESSLNLPAGIAIDYENISFFEEFIAKDFEVEFLIHVANQPGEITKPRIRVYGFGKNKTAEYPADEELRKNIPQ